MKINHFIIGSDNVKKSTAFYCDLFGFKKTDDDPGAEDVKKFEAMLSKADMMGLEPRSEPSKNSKRGFGIFKRGSTTFKNFYVSDPSGSNIEVMVYIVP